MATRENEFPVSALVDLVESAALDVFCRYEEDYTEELEQIVEEVKARLDKALDGKVLVEVEGDDEPCEHEEYGPVVIMVERPMFTAIACLKCGEREAAGEGVG